MAGKQYFHLRNREALYNKMRSFNAPYYRITQGNVHFDNTFLTDNVEESIENLDEELNSLYNNNVQITISQVTFKDLGAGGGKGKSETYLVNIHGNNNSKIPVGAIPTLNNPLVVQLKLPLPSVCKIAPLKLVPLIITLLTSPKLILGLVTEAVVTALPPKFVSVTLLLLIPNPKICPSYGFSKSNEVASLPLIRAKSILDWSVRISVCVVDPMVGGYNIGSFPIKTCLVSELNPISPRSSCGKSMLAPTR